MGVTNFLCRRTAIGYLVQGAELVCTTGWATRVAEVGAGLWYEPSGDDTALEEKNHYHSFCSTNLPLVSTRSSLLTLSSLYPLFWALLSINLSNIERKILGSTENQLSGCWLRSKNATPVLCSLPNHYHSFPGRPRLLCKWSHLALTLKDIYSLDYVASSRTK